MRLARMPRYVLIFLLTIAILAPHPARATATATLYSVTDLGTFGGTFSVAVGINNPGQVAGLANLPGDTALHAFLWQNGVLHDLGTLGGQSSGAFAINASGQAVGRSDTTNPGGDANFCFTAPPCNSNRAVLFDRDGPTDLGTLGGPGSGAGALNDLHQVTGSAETTVTDPTSPFTPLTPEWHAFLWAKSAMTDLGTLGGPDSQGNGINDAGQVAGYSMIDAVSDPPFGHPEFHAVLWSHGSMTDLGTLGGPQSFANSIDNQGQVVGNADTTIPDPTSPFNPPTPEFHAILWDSSMMSDLGAFPGDPDSVAVSMNNRGQIVGQSGNASVPLHAVLWQNGTVSDLNTLIPADSGWVLIAPNGINERGEIVGFGIHNGQGHAFLLTPGMGQGDPAPAQSTAERQALVHTALATLPANMQGLMRWSKPRPARIW